MISHCKQRYCSCFVLIFLYIEKKKIKQDRGNKITRYKQCKMLLKKF